MSVFKDKVLLITGGTGSFGNALDSDIKEIRIFSRDEKKQDDMRYALARINVCLRRPTYVLLISSVM